MKIIIFLVGLFHITSVLAQDLYFNVTFEYNDKKFQFPAYWRDHGLLDWSGASIHSLSEALGDEDCQTNLIKLFETSSDHTKWPPIILFVVSRCYWTRRDVSNAIRAIGLADDATEVRHSEITAWRALLEASRGLHHQWVMDDLILANKSSPSLDYDWCLFWECCRAGDNENGSRFANQLTNHIGLLNKEERYLLLWFTLQTRDSDYLDSLIENQDLISSPATDDNVAATRESGVGQALVSLIIQQFGLSETSCRDKLLRFLDLSEVDPASFRMQEGRTILPKNENDVEVGCIGLGIETPYHNLIRLSMPYSPPPPNESDRFLAGSRIVSSLLDFNPAMDCLTKAFESGRVNPTPGIMETILLGYLSRGEYEKANRIFPDVVAGIGKDEFDESLLLMQVESCLLVKSDVEAGMKLALEYSQKCNNPRFRHLALWAALAVENYSVAKNLLNEDFNTGTSDPWFNYAIQAALTFAINCPDEEAGKVVFDQVVNLFCQLPPEECKSAMKNSKFLSTLGRSAARRYNPSFLSNENRADPMLFTSHVIIQFVEGNERNRQ